MMDWGHNSLYLHCVRHHKAPLYCIATYVEEYPWLVDLGYHCDNPLASHYS